jgi:hypothetical protein
MKIVILISVIEMSVLMAWLIYKHYRQQAIPAVAGQRSVISSTNSRRPNRTSSFPESAHHPLMNERLMEGQRDDRQQMDGSVAADAEIGIASVRAFARRSHQLMFKRWSQERRGEGLARNKTGQYQA